MSAFTDPTYLRCRQYRDDSKLNARIALHRRFSINPTNWFHWLFDQFDLPAPARLLELGCGPASLWRENCDRIPPAWDVTLSDFSPGMLASARAGLSACAHPFHFRQIDAQAIPYPRGQFDAVIANHMLYHVPDRGRALAEICRLLRPGGRLYAALNGDRHMAELADMLHRLAPDLDHPRNEREATGLTLENAPAEFAPWFSHVEVRLYEPNGLVVTEAGPLLAYIRSMLTTGGATEADLARLRRHIEAQIAARGAVRITKSTGLLIAHP